jgi:hypothetical protein
LGKEKTIQTFNGFLDEMDARNRELDVQSIQDVDFVKWTNIQIKETMELVVNQAACVDELDLSLYERLLGVGV